MNTEKVTAVRFTIFVKKKFGTDLQYSLFNLDELLNGANAAYGSGKFFTNVIVGRFLK